MSMPQIKLKIRFYGDVRLRRRAKPVKAVGEKERFILAEMSELMYLHGGIGLAAPQVGIDRQMVIVDVGKGPVALINPRIVKKNGTETMEEGCLSLPGISVRVKRAKNITVCALNENNERISLSVQDLFARALQHEIDHLRGRLIIDYANFIQKLALRKKLKCLKALSR